MNKQVYITKDGCQLMCRSSLCDNNKADILFCHGFQEHSGRYQNEAIFFNKHGFNFYTYDQRSHGESDGKLRSYINTFDEYINDFDEILKFYKLGIKKPLYIFSHSMGGLVVTSFLLEREYQIDKLVGLMYSAPLLKPNEDLAPILQFLSPIIASILPKLKTIKLDVNEISTDPGERKKYLEDPLIYKEGVYARSGDSLLKQMKKISRQLNKINLPFIIQHGINDKLAEFKGSKALFERSESPDKILIPLEDIKHEITKDYNHRIVLENFLNWMNDRL